MDCNECKYYGCNYDEGPYCEMEGACPFEEPKKDVDKVKFEMSLAHLEDDILRQFRSTLTERVDVAIRDLIEKEYGEQIKKMTVAAMETLLTEQVQAFMEQPIQIGGSWVSNPARTLTRSEYLSEIIAERLEKSYDQSKFTSIVTEEVRRQIVKFTDALKKDVTKSVNTTFTEATRSALGDAMVAMLMNNETFQRLNMSIKQLGEGN